jgi:hypothetical protein
MAQTELIQADWRKSTSLLKKLLKQRFNIKCTVRSESYSMGCSLRVGYDLGIASEVISSLLDNLQYGRFDGMTDLSYSVKVDGIDFEGYKLAQFKHVFVGRDIDTELKLKMIQQLVKDHYTEFKVPETYTEATEYNVELRDKLGGWASTFNDIFFRDCKNLNFNTQDHTKVLIKESIRDDEGGYYFIYELDGVEYDTRTYGVKEVVKEKPAPVEVSENEIKIISYSDKAIAVVGDTKRFKDELKEAGGRFNFRLSCGAGWIFPKTKIENVKTLLTSLANV